MEEEHNNSPIGSNHDHRWTKIQARLETAKECLVTDGSVVRKAGSSCPDTWIVRYRDRRQARTVQRTIYLGDGELAEKARALIRRWRAEALTPEDRRRDQLLGMADLLAASRGYAPRARRRLRAAAAEASADPREAWKFVVRVRQDDGEFRFGKRPGRPAKAGLW
jgi:hypothetical protein